jgi:hypothetical protein
MTRLLWLIDGSVIALAIVLGTASAAPRQRSVPPPTYHCEPGTPNPTTLSCDCPDGYREGSHGNAIPFCRKAPRPPPPPIVNGLGCGEIAPRVRAVCTRACGDDQRDPPAATRPGEPWLPLTAAVHETKRSCHHGPTADASVAANCAVQADRFSLEVTTSAGRIGDCQGCAGSEAAAGFEWRTIVPRRSQSAVFVTAQQHGGAAASRCALVVDSIRRSWAEAEAGIVRSLDAADVSLGLQCMDRGELTSATCTGIDAPITIAVNADVALLPPPSIAATGERGPAGFDHGMQTTQYCGNNPESWVRGSAKLDTATGTVTVDIELETDSTLAGPKGRVVIEVHGDGGRLLVTLESSEVGIGGKPPGHAVSRRFSSHASLTEVLARRARTLSIRAACTGAAPQLWGIGGDPTHNFGLAVH